MSNELIASLLLVAAITLIFISANDKVEKIDQCQKHFNLKTKNTTIYEQEKVLHKEDKPARIVIECEVRK